MYFSYISGSYSLKNTLYIEVYQFLLDMSRRLIHIENIEAFKETIEAGIKSLNKKNSRCKPIRPSWREHNNVADFDLLIGAGTICTFHLYKSLGEVVELEEYNRESLQGLGTFNKSLVKHLE